MRRNENGFSLFELLIVVSMIAILTSIALPRFAAFTVQGHNATAAADCRNAAVAEKAFFANWGVYSSSAPGAAPGAGSILTTNANSTGQIPANSISPTAPVLTVPAPGFQIGVSQNAAIVINTSPSGESYVIGAKNAVGDRCFGMDSDTAAMHWVNGSVGMPLMSGAVPSSTPGYNDLAGVAGSSSCNGNPGGTGQVTWVAI
jgi:prepilin-type N-terminal cleavage/methylation domain-containing protein